MKKRFPAFFLALALCLGLAVPAFAADADTSAELYVSMEEDNYPFSRKGLEIQVRGVDDDGKFSEPADYSGFADFVVPTSEYFQVGVYNLAEGEEGAIIIRAISDPDGDGIYDLRLFRTKEDAEGIITGVSVLPLPKGGSYKITDGIVNFAPAVVISGFDQVEDGDYAFSAARLHKLFGNNTIVEFYSIINEEEQYLGQVLLSKGSFEDVPGADWYGDPVAWAVEKGITTGSGEGYFEPGSDCTHIQILTFLSRAAGNTSSADYGWAEEQMMVMRWAKEKGMIGEGFESGKPCTRAEAVYYIWQAFDKPSAAPSGFTDVDENADYAKAVDWAVEKGITRGDGSEEIFAPDKVCSRAHIVTFLWRAFNN